MFWYLELVMLFRFGVDLLLLLGTNRLTGQESDFKRLLLGAVLGAVYSGGCLNGGFDVLNCVPMRLLCMAGIGMTAFGLHKNDWKQTGIFILLSFLLELLAQSVGEGKLLPLLLLGTGVWLLSRSSGMYVPIEITGQLGSVCLTGLRDSGNTLRDPITGERVLVIGRKAAQRLTGLTEEQIRNPLSAVEDRSIPGLRLIPFSSIGQGNGMMLAMRFPQVKIAGRIASRIVGFAPQGLEEDRFQALAGGFV